MIHVSPLEERANKFVADKIREIRGDEARTKFGARVGCTEAMIFQYENQRSRPSYGRLVYFARVMGISITDFLAPDEVLDAPSEPVRKGKLKKA